MLDLHDPEIHVRMIQLTLDLLKSVSVQSADLGMLLFQSLKASAERVCDLEVVVIGASRSLVATGLCPFKRCFHLPDSCDNLLRFIDHGFLFGGHTSNLILEGLG